MLLAGCLRLAQVEPEAFPFIPVAIGSMVMAGHDPPCVRIGQRVRAMQPGVAFGGTRATVLTEGGSRPDVRAAWPTSARNAPGFRLQRYPGYVAQDPLCVRHGLREMHPGVAFGATRAT